MKKRYQYRNTLFLLFALTALFSCRKDDRPCPGSIEKDFALTGFTKISGGENFRITVTKGANFSVKARGCSNDLNDLSVKVINGGILELSYPNFKNKRYIVEFTITMPQLTAVNFSGNSIGKVSGFQGQNTVIRSVVSGNAEGTMNGAGINASFDISGNAKLTLTGTTDDLYGGLSGNGALHAYELTANSVDIEASGNAKAYVRPQESLFATVSGNSRIYYKGNPGSKHFSTSGNGKVIQE